MSRTSLILLCLCFSACFARGGVVGEQRIHFDASVPAIHQAALSVLDENGITVEDAQVDQQSSLIKARYADDTLLTIHSARFTAQASHTTIQVGTFGNEQRANLLVDQISAELGLIANSAP